MENNKIVYVGDNCGEMTKSDIMSEIVLYINEVDYFNHLSSENLSTLKEKLYNQLLERLEWQSPYTLLSEYDEEDIYYLLDGLN